MIISEQHIIQGCKRGLPAAQEAFYNAFGPRMKLICARYVRSSFEAEDLFHEALIKIFHKIKDYNGSGSFGGWVRTITVNAAIDYYHKENKLRIVSNNIYEQENAVGELNEENVFEKLASELSMDDLLYFIAKLPEGYRMVFNLYVIESFSHKEISHMLFISEGTSKSQLSKAKRMLREIVLSEYTNEHARKSK